MAFLLRNRRRSSSADQPAGPDRLDGDAQTKAAKEAGVSSTGVAHVARVTRGARVAVPTERIEIPTDVPKEHDGSASGPVSAPALPSRPEPSFRFWAPSDEKVFDGPFAFDSETTPIDKQDPWTDPDFVIGGVFNGSDGFYIERPHLQAFLAIHRGVIAMHHAPFDLAVIDKAAPGARIYDRVDRNQVVDTQLLHRLLKLATEGHTAFGKGQATLERCAADYLGVELPKGLRDSRGDDVRTSYGQWLGRDPSEIDDIYLKYLAKDATITWQLYQRLQQLILEVLGGSSATWGFVSPKWLEEQVRRWGLLTHHIQLKAAIVLKDITRNGLHVDTAAREQRCRDLQEVGQELLIELLGQYDFRPGKGSAARLQEILTQIERQHPDLTIPRTKTGKLSTKRTVLEELADRHPFCRLIVDHRAIEKLKSTFLKKMDVQVVHPSFDVLKTTGRTSSFGQINAQNLPRDDRIRACFVPSPGHVFLDADYSTIELATLAQSCLSQFQLASQMADAINEGQDLHRLVAASFFKKAVENVTDEERQRAKPINFGRPGGMGENTVKTYAKASYGIELSDAEVTALSDSWFAMFPEMRDFLSNDGDDNGQRVADYFELTPAGYHETTGSRSFLDHRDNTGRQDEPHAFLGFMVIKVLGRPEPARQDGRPYTETELDFFWSRVAARIEDLPRDAHIEIQERRPSPDLRRLVLSHICRDRVFTLTGRLRANATYCARHNTVFQGLAADGAKLALWQLWRCGFRIVNFVHDEVVVEIPENVNLGKAAQQVRALMISGMRQVVPDVRVEVEYAAARRWYKKAKAVFDPETGALVPWEPQAKK